MQQKICTSELRKIGRILHEKKKLRRQIISALGIVLDKSKKEREEILNGTKKFEVVKMKGLYEDELPIDH